MVALLFLAVAVPPSSVARWLVDILSGGWGAAGRRTQSEVPASSTAGAPLRGAIAAMISPKRTVEEYDHLYRLVAERLNRRVEIVQRKRYGEVNELLEHGEVDFAWVCTGVVADLLSRGVADPLVAPVVGGRSRYRAYLVVRSDSGITKLDQLRGRSFAFTDPLSLTGRAVVIDSLRALGETPVSFFSGVFFTHAHDNSIRAVQRGLADGATVDSLVFDLLVSRYPDEVRNVRVIWESELFPIPPIVVSREQSPKLRVKLRETLLSLHEGAEGRAILDRIGVERFVVAQPADYGPR